MLVRKGEEGEGLHCPVGRSGSVVLFRHEQVGIAVADGQESAVVNNGMLRPKAQMAFDKPLHYPIGNNFQFTGSAHGEKGYLSKAVSQRTAVGRQSRPLQTS